MNTQRFSKALAALAWGLGGLGLLSSSVSAQPLAAQDAGPTFQLRAAELLLADGTRIEDGVVLVEDGRIRKLGRGVEVDPNLPLVEHDGLVTAGLVACQSASGTNGGATDPTRSILPEAHALNALDPDHHELTEALEAGITTIVLTGGRTNVVGGHTAVVKTTGRVVRDGAHLALSLSRATFGGGEPAAGAVEATGSSRRGLRFPTSYAGATAELDRLFGAGEGAFGAAKRGELPVLIEAWERHEVVRAAELAKRHGLVGAVRGATLAADLVGVLRESGLGVVLGPFRAAQPTRVIEGIRAVVDAGIPLAFALDAPANDPTQMRLTAAQGVAAGADPAATLRALTSDAARLAGVGDRVGSLERGRDADFVLWSGDPLNLTTRIEAVYVDGVLVHRGGQ